MSASSGAPIPLEGWQGSTGISGSFQSESVATFAWNRWQVSTGISGNLRAEYAGSGLRRISWATPGFGMLSTQAQFDINFSPSLLLKHYPISYSPMAGITSTLPNVSGG